MQRVYNFSAGPSMLPLEVLEQAQKELVVYKDSGMSVMEMSHRSKVFEEIIQTAEKDLRILMNIPDNYKVLFLQGGGSTQFAMVPLNLFHKSMSADYVHTGQWTKKAMPEAKLYGNVNIVASSEDKNFSYIPTLDSTKFNPEADYFYICYNNTIYGTHYTPDKLPETGSVPLVGDISSNILAEKIDVSKFGLLFAGAQKNLGPAGVTIAIIREDLVGHHLPITPTMLRYETHVKNNSLYNTPPCYSIYMVGLVLKWLLAHGGVEAMQKINESKAALLYDYLDQSSFFTGTVAKEDRSLMNVPFVSPSEELNAKFIKEAADKGLVNLKGHRTVGGMRASIYNAMPFAGVQSLVDFMADFEKNNK